MADYNPKACKTVGKGEVGEPGPTAFIEATVSGTTSKMMVVRTVETSLCGNTGAIAILIVNGDSAAHGIITAKGSSIQAEAKPGDRVIAIVHAIPLYNGIKCVRLGVLNAELDECDLV